MQQTGLENLLNNPYQMGYITSERGDGVAEDRTILTDLHQTIEGYLGISILISPAIYHGVREANIIL